MTMMKLENVSYAYGKKKVLKDINLTFDEGKIYAIVGKSGVGKTTLLSLMSGLADPTEGDVFFNSKCLRNEDKYQFRAVNAGIIFQSYNLINNMTAKENVVLAMDIAEVKKSKEVKVYEASQALESVGIDEEDQERRILKLSGGQQQRVAIARMLAKGAEIILADEPTGNLDRETEKEILDILRKLANEGKCVVIVTHSDRVADVADVVYRLT